MSKRSFKAVEFRQGNHPFIMLPMNAKTLKDLSYTEVFDEDNENGDQRPISLAHVKQFAEAIQDKDALHPQSLVGTLMSGEVVNSKDYDIDKQFNDVHVIFSDEIKCISLTDGQHTLAAVGRCPDDIQESFGINLVLSTNKSVKVRKMIHNGINAYHKKADQAVITYSQIMQCGQGTPDEERLGKIYDRARKDRGSALQGRIKTHHNGIKHGLKAKALGFNDFIKYSATNGCNICRLDEIRELTDEQLYEVVNSYYTEFATTAGDDWDAPKEVCIIGHKMGLKVLTACMVETFKLIINANEPLTAKSIKRFIDERMSTEAGKERFKKAFASSTNRDVHGWSSLAGYRKNFWCFLNRKDKYPEKVKS